MDQPAVDQPAVELGSIRGALAFHHAELTHTLMERGGRSSGLSLGAWLALAREQFPEGTLERHTFETIARENGMSVWPSLLPYPEAAKAS